MKLLIISACMMLIACSSGSKNDAPKSIKVEAKGDSVEFQLRPYKEIKLANGLTVLLIEDNSLPRVDFQLLVKVGAILEEPQLSGLNSITANLFTEGTEAKSATQLADALGQMGTDIMVNADHDYTIFSTSGLTLQANELLHLFYEVISAPAFSQKEVDRLKAQEIASLQKAIDNPGTVANREFDRYLFGNHPYGTPEVGKIETIKKISRKDIIKHYFKYYRPSNAMLAIVAPRALDIEKAVRSEFEKWSDKSVKVEWPVVEVQKATSNSVKLVTKAGLKQAQIKIGHLGIKRDDADFLQLRVANMIFGGSFGSRLNMKIRDDLGLTYSIYSYFDPRKETGTFSISTFSRQEKVGETIAETTKAYREFYQKGVTDKELASAKAVLMGQFPQAIETSSRLATSLLVLRYYGIPDSYLQDYLVNIGKISKDEVNKAIKKHFNPDGLKILVYADEAAVKTQLGSMPNLEIQKVKAE